MYPPKGQQCSVRVLMPYRRLRAPLKLDIHRLHNNNTFTTTNHAFTDRRSKTAHESNPQLRLDPLYGGRGRQHLNTSEVFRCEQIKGVRGRLHQRQRSCYQQADACKGNVAVVWWWASESLTANATQRLYTACRGSEWYCPRVVSYICVYKWIGHESKCRSLLCKRNYV